MVENAKEARWLASCHSGGSQSNPLVQLYLALYRSILMLNHCLPGNKRGTPGPSHLPGAREKAAPSSLPGPGHQRLDSRETSGPGELGPSLPEVGEGTCQLVPGCVLLRPRGDRGCPRGPARGGVTEKRSASHTAAPALPRLPPPLPLPFTAPGAPLQLPPAPGQPAVPL